MRNICIILFVTLPLTLLGQTHLITNPSPINVGITGTIDGVYINEFHYDNTGADTGEFVEVAGPAGTNLSTYSISLYNGGDNLAYQTVTLSGIIDDEGSGIGAISFTFSNIQNGAPDGIALSKSGNTNVQFLSYEGTLTAADGVANGVLSVDITVDESSATPEGYALEYDEGSTAWVVVTNDSPGDFMQGSALSSSAPIIKGFKLYPVPASNDILNILSSLDTAMNITVYDISGKIIINKNINSNRLNVSLLYPGIYILRVSQNNASITKKLIIP